MGMQPVRSDAVWGHLRALFVGTALLFLINIYFGFDNALTTGEIPRWQLLIHLHAGSIGWITLAAVGVAVWVLTGEREVSSVYERRVGRLVWAAILVFAAYIPNFWLAFSRGGGFLVALLPTFGSLAVVVLWVAAVFALVQLRHQAVVTTVHLLAALALVVAAIGATMGALLGLERVLGLGPSAPDVGPWLFFGTVWLVVFLGLFLWAVGTGGDFASLPPWFSVAFTHAGFVGMMTNLILGVLSARAHGRRRVLAWGEPTALWLTNLGLLAFIVLKAAADIRLGAIVMGVGVLVGVATMLVRLASDAPRPTPDPVA